MADRQKSISLPRQVGGIVGLAAGALLLYGAVLGLIGTLLDASRADGMFWLLTALTIAVGGGICWGGATLCVRWKVPLGIVLVLLGLNTIRTILGLRARALTLDGGQAAWHTQTAFGYTLVALLLGLVGLGLLVLGLRRWSSAATPPPA